MDAQRLELRAPHPPSRHAKRSKWLELAAAQRGRTIALAAIATPRFLKIVSISEPELLRASHIKPWAKCETDQERLNVFNGLLLAVHLDAAFDRGFITFDDAGRMVVSSRLSPENAQRLGLKPGLSLTRIDNLHRAALAWHRANCFR